MSLKRLHPQPLDATPPPKRARRFSIDSHNYSPLRPLQIDEKLQIYREYCYQHKRKDCPRCFDPNAVIYPCTNREMNDNEKDEETNNQINDHDNIEEKPKELVQIPLFREVYKKTSTEKYKCPKEYIQYKATFDDIWEKKVEYLADTDDEEFVTNFFPVFDKNKVVKKRKNSYDVNYRLNLFELIIDKFEKAAITLLLQHEKYLYMNERRKKDNCSVCNTTIQFNDSKDHTITCKSCHVTVHHCCYYGVPNEEKEKGGKNQTKRKKIDWQCDYCQANPEEENSETEENQDAVNNLFNINDDRLLLGTHNICILCPESGGALKRTNNDDEEQWCHILCALLIPETSPFLMNYFVHFPFLTVLNQSKRIVENKNDKNNSKIDNRNNNNNNNNNKLNNQNSNNNNVIKKENKKNKDESEEEQSNQKKNQSKKKVNNNNNISKRITRYSSKNNNNNHQISSDEEDTKIISKNHHNHHRNHNSNKKKKKKKEIKEKTSKKHSSDESNDEDEDTTQQSDSEEDNELDDVNSDLSDLENHQNHNHRNSSDYKKRKLKTIRKKSPPRKPFKYIEGIELIKRSRFNQACYICRKKKGACIECEDDRCRNVFHVSCARNNGNFVEVICDSNLQPKFVAYCKSHSLDHWVREKNDEWEILTMNNLDKILEIAIQHKKLNTLSKSSLKEVLNYWVKKRKALGHPLLPRLRLIKLKEEGEKYIEEQFKRDYHDLLQFRRKLEYIRILIDLAARREKMKRNLLEYQMDLFNKELLLAQTLTPKKPSKKSSPKKKRKGQYYPRKKK